MELGFDSLYTLDTLFPSFHSAKKKVYSPTIRKSNASPLSKSHSPLLGYDKDGV